MPVDLNNNFNFGNLGLNKYNSFAKFNHEKSYILKNAKCISIKHEQITPKNAHKIEKIEGNTIKKKNSKIIDENYIEKKEYFLKNLIESFRKEKKSNYYQNCFSENFRRIINDSIICRLLKKKIINFKFQKIKIN